MAAADYAEKKPVTPPPELVDWLRSKQFGCLPHAGGWKEQSYRYVNRGMVYYNAYRVTLEYKTALKDSKTLKTWMKHNRETMDAVKKIEDIRRAISNPINGTDSH